MPRTLSIALCIGFLTVSACSKDGDKTQEDTSEQAAEEADPFKEMRAIVEKGCACKDRRCVDAAIDEAQAHPDFKNKDKLGEEDALAFDDLFTELIECAKTITGQDSTGGW